MIRPLGPVAHRMGWPLSLRVFISTMVLAMLALHFWAMMMIEGLVAWETSDGAPYHFRDISGSMSGQDEYLAFGLLWLPLLVMRVLRIHRSLWLTELLWFLVCLTFTCVAYSSLGHEVIVLSLKHDHTYWFMTYLASLTISIPLYLVLIGERWGARFARKVWYWNARP